MRSIIWFREDLRIYDNSALFHAAQKSNSGLIGLYILDPSMWKNHHVAACRVEFILRGLQELSRKLAKLNIPLVIKQVKSTEIIPQEIFKITQQVNADVLFFNRQYEVNEAKRDQLVRNYLGIHNISCYSYDDQVILTPGRVLNQQGDYYKVFTAYKRAWYREFMQQEIALFSAPKKQEQLNIESCEVPLILKEFKSSINPKLWPAGEKYAQRQLQKFIEDDLFLYQQRRNFPAIAGTSKLSPYLATGMISARQCFIAALKANQGEVDTGNKDAVTWMAELIWRDFYKYILVQVPRISMGKPYKLATEKISWDYNETHFQAWQQGKTGFPIIDAAMRQLKQTGWMHNRLRMVTAMFLAKNLLLDWRLGEQYFMSQLIDGDLAANNGGWQWCASTGTDAVPYFRIFNPITQSQRFDAEGNFIRQYCPELAVFDNKAIHEPYRYEPIIAKQIGYPEPIIDLEFSRKRAIAIFRQVNKA